MEDSDLDQYSWSNFLTLPVLVFLLLLGLCLGWTLGKA